MNYLVTGAAGFIASELSRSLVLQGHTVLGVDNLNDAYDVRLKHWRLLQMKVHPQFAFHQVDICNRAALTDLFAEHPHFDAILHLAGRAGVRYSVEKPEVYVDANIHGTLNLLRLAAEHTVTKFVLASSSSVYGTLETWPYKEDDNTDTPVSPYAATKKAAEVMAHSYHHLHGIDVSALRFFTVYGPASRPDMSPFRFVRAICEGNPITVFGDGSQMRDFTHVSDIARGIIASLKPVGCRSFNLGCGKPIVLLDAIRTIEDVVGKKAQIRFAPSDPSDVRGTWADTSRALTELNWAPEVSFKEGIATLADWYLQNRTFAKDLIE